MRNKTVRRWRQEMYKYVEQFGGYPATGEGEKFDIKKIGKNGSKAYCQVADRLNKNHQLSKMRPGKT